MTNEQQAEAEARWLEFKAEIEVGYQTLLPSGFYDAWMRAWFAAVATERAKYVERMAAVQNRALELKRKSDAALVAERAKYAALVEARDLEEWDREREALLTSHDLKTLRAALAALEEEPA